MRNYTIIDLSSLKANAPKPLFKDCGDQLMSMSIAQARDFVNECPSCGSGFYLASLVLEMDGEGPSRVKMMCGEEYFEKYNIPGIPVKGKTFGCGHAWEWTRD